MLARRFTNLREFIGRCYTVWHLSTTISVTPFLSRESSFYNMFWNFVSKKSAVFRKQACISLLQSAEAHPRLLTKR